MKLSAPLDAGDKKDSSGSSSLMLASHHSHVKVVLSLLDAGAGQGLANSCGTTARMGQRPSDDDASTARILASYQGHVEVAQQLQRGLDEKLLLLAAGYRCRHRRKLNQQTATRHGTEHLEKTTLDCCYCGRRSVYARPYQALGACVHTPGFFASLRFCCRRFQESWAPALK